MKSSFTLPYYLYKIRKKRFEIAQRMNAKFDHPGSFQSFHQVPSVDMEVQYAHSHNIAQQQEIAKAQALKIPTVVHNQPNPSKSNKQVDPFLQQNVGSYVPVSISTKQDI